MTKQKPGSTFRVADGAGGLRPVSDHRFDQGPWPIAFVVPADAASDWMAHYHAELEHRGWSANGISQLEGGENSGSLSIYAPESSKVPVLMIVWEKRRGDPLQVKARPCDDSVSQQALASEFIHAINERARKGVTTQAHRWDVLTYDGLPWKGELWLSEHLRLGPPSSFPETLLGPQMVIVDVMVEGIGSQGIVHNFQKLVLELRIFLSVVLGTRMELARLHDGWVAEFDEKLSPVSCSLRSVGYLEVGPAREFPQVGVCLGVPEEAVARPGVGRIGVWPDMRERWVPADIKDLWRVFAELAPETRDHLLRAGNAYVIARSMWPEQRTAYAAFLVVACEALKPPGRRGHAANIYDVVAALAGAANAAQLRKLALHPQKVRSDHFHRGILAAEELLPMLVSDPFRDPSFDEMLSELSRISRICFVEWLRCKGEYKLPAPRRRSTKARNPRHR